MAPPGADVGGDSGPDPFPDPPSAASSRVLGVVAGAPVVDEGVTSSMAGTDLADGDRLTSAASTPALTARPITIAMTRSRFTGPMLPADCRTRMRGS